MTLSATASATPAPIPAIPFWFWNGEQDETRIDAQLQAAAAAGMRGFAIHARKGNRTPYLGARWMELVRHACDTAARLGLEIWLYDEEDYPSGTAGWRIQRDEPELRQRTLAWTSGTVATLGATAEPIVAFRLGDLMHPVSLADLVGDEPALLFHVERTERYVDTLDPRSVQRFIASTHDAYATALGTRLGTVVTAVYTDDVNYHLQDRKGLGWTADAPREFHRRYGYDLLARLPALVADLPGAARVRIDFHCLLGELFRERWVRPQAAWCRAHGVAFIGHLRGDEGPLWQSLEQYGSAMAYYREQDLPSIDDFLMRARDGAFTSRARTDFNLSPALLYRQAASVADQFKTGRVSSEVLASMGWAGTPAEAHRHLLFQQLLGITDLTHHACSYATAGEAKRDHPPSWFTQQPWWAEHGQRIFARQARLSGWVAEGTAVVRVLVLWPTLAGFAALRGADRRPVSGLPVAGDVATCDGYEEQLAQLALALVRHGVPFHLADDLTLDVAQVRRATLNVGAMAYDHVVVPPWPHVGDGVTALLATAEAAGVQVHRWDGGAAHALAARLPSALAGLGDSGAVVVNVRRGADGTSRWVVGNCGDRDLPLAIAPGAGTWRIEDLASGTTVHCDTLPASDLLLPANAAWRIAPAAPTDRTLPIAVPGTRRSGGSPRRQALADWRWQPATTLLPLDAGQDATGRWWQLRSLPDGTERPRQLIHRLTLPAGTTLRGIAGEQLAALALQLNGAALPAPSTTHPASADLHVIPLELVGPHDLALTCNLSGITGRVEDVILLIDGMVEAQHDPLAGWQPRIVPWRDPGSGVDLARHGLPFHWGPLVAECTVTIANPSAWRWLDLGPVAASAVVTLNGSVLGALDHAPWRIALGDALRPGVNHLSVSLAGTAQNCFGPHRNAQAEATVWAPSEGGAQLPDQPYHLAPFGLLGQPALCDHCPGQPLALAQPSGG